MAKLIWLIVLLALSACEGYKILVLFPIPAKSHGILANALINHLLKAGHQVTAIVAFANLKHPNLTQVVPKSNFQVFNESSLNIKSIMDKEQDLSDFPFLLEMMHKLSLTPIKDEDVQIFLRDPNQKFDVVIGEWMFSEVYSTISALYDCPFIWFSTLEPHWLVLRLIDQNMNPAYNADYVTSYIPPFSFSSRVSQLWRQMQFLNWKLQYEKKEEDVYINYIAPIIQQRGKVAPPYYDLMYNASIMLGNSHASLGLAPRLPQNYISIGGYHVDRNVKPLPEDLKKILGNAKHGVIYFSMGSNLKSKDLPLRLKESFLNIFSKLNQTVIWKFEEVFPNLPKNVHILKWAPQPSILAHPNCILFITHGGLLSITETVHFGKPLIGIPVFADQFGNVEKAVNKGFGRKVELSYNMDKDLEVEINEMLGNPKYAQKAKEWSFLYHHRIATPEQEIIHWVEHVIESRGAPHLRSLALLVPWYQKLYLDLLALVLVGLILVVIVLKAALTRILSASKTNEKKKSL